MVTEVNVFCNRFATIITDPATEWVDDVIRLMAIATKNADRPAFYGEVDELILDVVIPVTALSQANEYIQGLVDSKELPYTVINTWQPETNEPF